MQGMWSVSELAGVHLRCTSKLLRLSTHPMIVACQWNRSSGELGPDTWKVYSRNNNATGTDNAKKVVEVGYKPS